MIKIQCFLMIFLAFMVSSCNKENNIVLEEQADEFLNNNYTPDSLYRVNSVIQLSDRSFILAGGVKIKGSYNKNMIIKLDEFGNREWLSVMDNSKTPLGLEAIFVNGNNYIGYRSTRYSEEPPMFINFDGRGNVLAKIPIDNCIVSNDIIKEEHSYLIAGDHNYMQFQKIGFDGKVLWTKEYRQNPGVLSISKLADGNYIALAGENYTGIGEYLVKLSVAGEVIWSKPYKGVKILALPDNGFIAITGREPNFDVIRFDENGNEVWKKAIKDPGYSFPFDVDIINYGLEHFVFSKFTNNQTLDLCILNTNGELVNTVVVNDISSTNHISLIKTIDNGIFIVRSEGNYNLDFIKLSYANLIKSPSIE